MCTQRGEEGVRRVGFYLFTPGALHMINCAEDTPNVKLMAEYLDGPQEL